MRIPRLEQYLQLAIEHRASDLLIAAGSKPALKIFGDVIFIEGAAVVTKDMAEKYLLDMLSPEQKEHFEANLDIDFSLQLEDFGRFRANAFLNKDGVGIVLRLIPSVIPAFDELALPEVVRKFVNFKNGLVLLTGTTGSGKSTTLASLIQEINHKKKKHIVTIEDPIEFVYQNEKSLVNQREIYTNTQNFHSALRSAVREAADVILVGEMRDPETVALALEAAETGALVFSTLHTSGTAKSIDRIIDMFPFEKQNQVRSSLSLSLQAIVWQELLKKKDKTGRVVASEVLINTSEVASMIRKNVTHQIGNAIETGSKDGMVTMKQSLDKLKEEGLL